MMKSKYTAPEVEIIFFKAENIVTESTELPWDGFNRSNGTTWE